MARAVSHTLVGRDAEWARFDEAARMASDGIPAIVLVEGEPGIGKTRLVSQWSARQRQHGVLVATGRCVEVSGEELPFAPVAGVLRDLRRQLGVERIRALAGAGWPGLVGLLPDLGGTQTTGVDRSRLFGTVQTLVEALAVDRSLVLVVEDLHWADGSTRDLIGYLARTLSEIGLVLVLTARSVPDRADELGGFFAELVRIPSVESLRLERLSPQDVAAQAADIAGHDLPVGQLGKIVAMSDGVPFLVEELVAAGVQLDKAVPERARQIVGVRLASLTPAAHRLVDAASLADAEFVDRVLRYVLPWDDSEVDAALRDALDTGVLVREPERDGYRFRHALLRATVAESLLPADRRRLHTRWAEAVEATASSLDPLYAKIAAAHHWYEAGDTERAFVSAIDASRACREAHAYPEAVPLCLRALSLWNVVPDADSVGGITRLGVVHMAGDSLMASGDMVGWEALATGELRRPDEAMTPLQRTQLDVDVAFARESRGLPGQLGDIDALIATVQAEPPSPEKLAVCLDLTTYICATNPRGAVALADHAVATAHELRDPDAEEAALAIRACRWIDVGAVEPAIDVLRPLLATWDTGVVPMYLVGGYSELGRFDEAVTAAEESLGKVSDPRQDAYGWSLVAARLLDALIATGRWDEAENLIGNTRTVPCPPADRIGFDCAAGALAARRGDLGVAAVLAGSLGLAESAGPMSPWGAQCGSPN